MEILTKTELRHRYDEIIRKIRNGAVFIHPSDTIYGLGCDAGNKQAVTVIRKLKQQFHQPLSVWVPAVEWVREHCFITPQAEEWLQKVPGPYTFILRLKKTAAVAPQVTLGTGTIGLRLPNHWLGKMVRDLNFPIVTTSANPTGKPFMTCLEDLDPDIANNVEFMIYEGEKKARPSTIVNLVEGTIQPR